MTTNYENLDGFEAAMIIVAVLGIGLIGFMLYSGLPANQQQNINQAVAIFDVTSQLQQNQQQVSSLLAYSNNYFDKFYIAFSEVAVLPPAAVEPPAFLAKAYNALLEYSDQIGTDYQAANSPASDVAAAYDRGQVLGTMIDLTVNNPNQDTLGSLAVDTLPKPVAEIPYRYEPPKLDWFSANFGKLNFGNNN